MKLEEFLAELDELILDTAQSLAITYCEDHCTLINENAFDVLPTIIAHINEPNQLENEGRLQGCVELVNRVAKMCNYDDVILILHKEIADTHDDTKFVHLLRPLKEALIQLPTTKFKYAIWCHNALQTFVNGLPAPESFDLEPPECILMETDNDVQRITSIFERIVDLYEAVVKVTREKCETLITIKYCLQLLGIPLVYLDMRLRNSSENASRCIVEKLIDSITSRYDPFMFLSWLKYEKVHDEDLEVNRLALSHFFYLILAEKMNYNRVPKVYDRIFVFRKLLYFLTELFTYDHQFVTEKGLLLAEETVTMKNLPYELLDDPIHCKFTNALSKVIIYSPLKDYRQQALLVMKKYILGFDNRGRYLLIHNTFNLVNHSGLMGYLITLYKDLLVEQFHSRLEFDACFRGTKLSSLLLQFCRLHKKEESDILELADQIVPALNLLRYLCLRDKDDVTGIRLMVDELSKLFMEPLKKGLIISKAHYKLKIKELEEEAAKGDRHENASKVSVTIGGQDLPNMTVVEKMSVLKASMTAFDVIESLLARLVECVDT